MGWNKNTWGDQEHGPLGHGFDTFLGLPFTLVGGFEKGKKESFFSVNDLVKKVGNFRHLFPESGPWPLLTLAMEDGEGAV